MGKLEQQSVKAKIPGSKQFEERTVSKINSSKIGLIYFLIYTDILLAG